ncbi:NAD(P)-dependent oxidoreductase [Blastococcus haudaquaticus]|nr:NAD(P)-binding domain-containing protein [Blastococcus haudaquaticus]
MTIDSTKTSVTVVGLGAMGAALASAFLEAGHPTTVWNRTPARAEPLMAAGALRAGSVAAAVEDGGVTMLCVRDHAAVRELLDPLADRLAGKAVVNLTSSTPEDARSTAEWAARHGVRYLDGAIMVPVPLIGGPDAQVLYSGSAEVFEEHRGTLLALGGEAEFLGAEPGLASLYDLGMLDVFFAGMASFLHAAAVMTADGVTARTFLPYANRVMAILPATLEGLARDVDQGRYPGDEDTLDMNDAALEHIVVTSRARGVDPGLPALVRALTRGAIADGRGGEGFSAVVEQLRSPGAATPGRSSA